MLYIFLAFVAYLLFRLIVDFVIPVYRTTKQVKRSFREMRQKMNESSNGTPSPQSTSTQKKESIGDYIDFEEVKE